MNSAPPPDMVSVLDSVAAPLRATDRHSETVASARRTGGRMGRFAGWCWRIAVGALFCYNIFTSILVTGWTYRWMRALVLRGWWKRSRFRDMGSFEDFCVSLGLDAPVSRPRWFWQERIGAHLRRPSADGSEPGSLRRLGRALLVPWYSLWINFKIGFQALFCTFLLTGWGCLLMVFSWEFGWVNSFSKGYELALIGPLTGVAGIGLFIAAMFYVPMAQVHQAVTGNCWAFFDFRFVWRLIQARLTAYVGLAAVVTVVSLPLELLKTLPKFFEVMNPALEEASQAELLTILRQYLLGCCLALFPVLLSIRLLAASIYRSAVLKVLRRGWVARSELHPVLADWLDRLGIAIPLARKPQGLARAVRFGGRMVYRRLLYGALVLIWFVFVAKVYVGEFMNYHPFFGFVNHPLVQLPCFDYVPTHLTDDSGS